MESQSPPHTSSLKSLPGPGWLRSEDWPEETGETISHSQITTAHPPVGATWGEETRGVCVGVGGIFTQHAVSLWLGKEQERNSSFLQVSDLEPACTSPVLD